MIDLEAFMARTGIDLGSIDRWIDREWLLIERRDTTLLLSDMDAARAQFIRDLQRDFGVNDEGIEIVLHLLDQVHGLRQALENVKQATGSRNRSRKRTGRRARQPRLLGRGRLA